MKVGSLFVSIFFLYAHASVAQIGDGVETPELNGHYVTIPPSPNSFEFTKYGNVPANEFTGGISPSINIWDYKAGHLELPISLDYKGNGVKISQFSSWTGINWNLNAGGVISRTINDEPDDGLGVIRYYYYDVPTEIDDADAVFISHLMKPVYLYDTQLDEFNFKFSHYSGSFYLNEDNEFVLANCDSELKIEAGSPQWGNGETLNPVQTIIITTPDGVRYYFGGEVREQTQVRSPQQGTPFYGLDTSYYLYKIENHLGENILFAYGVEPTYDLQYSRQEQVTTLPVNTVPLPRWFIYPEEGTYILSATNLELKVQNGRYLDSIYSNNSNMVIKFHSDPSGQMNPMNFKRVLDYIEIKNEIDNSHQLVDLEYTDYSSSTSPRFFLKNIIWKGRQNSTSAYEYKGDYRFEYFDQYELPGRFSASQDYVGYYNGKSNTTLLPLGTQFFPQGAGGIFFADRSPSFEHAVTGALKEIHYPTGGLTTFEYESNLYKKTENEHVTLNVYSDLSELSPNAYPEPDTQLTDGKILGNYITPTGQSGTGLEHDQHIDFTLSYSAMNYNHMHKLEVKVTNVTNINNPITIYQDEQSLPDPGDEDLWQHSSDFELDLEEGNSYRVELNLLMEGFVVDTAAVDAKLSFSYIKDYVPASGLGLRIKRITDFIKENKISGVKRYYYKSIKDYINGIMHYEALDWSSIYSGSSIIYGCDPIIEDWDIPILAISPEVTIQTLSANTYNSSVTKASGYFYPEVSISFGGDNFEKGGVEKKFKFQEKDGTINALESLSPGLSSPDNYDAVVHSNAHIYNGKLISKKNIINDPTIGLAIKKWKKYDYFVDRSIFTWNMYLDAFYHNCDIGASTPYGFFPIDKQFYGFTTTGIYMGFYKTYQNKLYLDTITDIDYIVPLPILSQDDTGYPKVVKKTYFDYGNYVGLPTTITETTSDENEALTTKLYYPNPTFPSNVLNSVPPPSGQEIVGWQDLLAWNRISRPIQKETYLYRNNILEPLFSTRTFYDRYPSLDRLLPSRMESSKGDGPFEKIVLFQEYSGWGFLKKVKRIDGPTSEYWYNGHGLVTRMIENSLGTEPQTTLFDYDTGYNLIKITDPRGKELQYFYDIFNRLIEVRDDTENILNTFEYNYRPH